MSTRSRSRSRSPPPSPFARVERLPCPDDVLHVPLAGVVKITIEFDGSQPNRIVQLLTERYPRDPWRHHGGSGGGAGGGSGGGGSAGNDGEGSGGGSGGGGSAGAAGAGSGGNAVAATRVLQPQPSTASSCYSDGILSRHTAHRQADSVPIFSIVGAGGPSGAATDGAATDGASAVVDGGDGVAVVDGGDGAAGEADLWPTSGGGATDGVFCVSQSGASGAFDARFVARRCFLKRLCGDASAASTGLPPTELLVLMSTEFLVLLSKGTASANGACGLTRMCCRSHLLQAAQAAQATLAVHGCRKMDYACLLKFRSLASRRKTALTCLPLGSSEAVGILSQRTGSPSGHRQDRAPQRALERNTRSRTTHK